MQLQHPQPPPPSPSSSFSWSTAASALRRSAAAAAALALLPALSPPPLPAAASAATTAFLLASTDGTAANLPADVLATALISLGKGASLDRLTASSSPPPSSSTAAADSTGPALYVTARAGARGRVLASVRVPLVRVHGLCVFVGGGSERSKNHGTEKNKPHHHTTHTKHTRPTSPAAVFPPKSPSGRGTCTPTRPRPGRRWRRA